MRELDVFFDVVQSGSMAKAAAQLRVKQPSVSDRRAHGTIEPSRPWGDGSSPRE